ncbi:MAG: 6-phosphofructokinase [Verrucomicrobiales bacterium]
MTKHIGILTSGGDCPCLNAAIRGVAKAGIGNFDMKFLGFKKRIQWTMPRPNDATGCGHVVRNSDGWRNDSGNESR